MSRRCNTGIFATLAVAFLAMCATWAIAQQSSVSGGQPLQHIAADAMSGADRAAVAMHQGDLGEVARIYGYTFEVEKWTYEQTICSSMPETILLHYHQIFADGTESLFVALVPRSAGRVHIVPVLYHNATPFVPAPKNPTNYALFNELVPEDLARKDATANGDWLQLSACYAEMTGGNVNISPDRKVNIGIATAPLPMNHIEIQDKTIRVTFADRESERMYRVWSISFNRKGRVKSATTEDRPVFTTKNALPFQSITPSETPKMDHSSQSSENATGATSERHPVAVTKSQPPENLVEPGGDSKSSVPADVSTPAQGAPSVATETLGKVSSQADETSTEPGWRLVSHPAEPPSKIVPPGLPPPEKLTPEPPDPTAQPVTQPQ